MAIKESALSLITSIAQGDWVRAVTSAGASRRVTVANLAKAIIESYTGSSLAGSSQSVKDAIDSLNSKTTQTLTSSIASGGSGVATKVGNVVTVQSAFSGITTSGKGWYDICTLPNGFAPSSQVDTVGVDNNASSSSDTPVQIRVTSAGLVRFYSQVAKNYAPNFCVTYVI